MHDATEEKSDNLWIIPIAIGFSLLFALIARFVRTWTRCFYWMKIVVGFNFCRKTY